MRLPTLLIADDHTILTERLVSMLRGQFEVVGTVADARRVLDSLQHPDKAAIELTPRQRDDQSSLPTFRRSLGRQ